MRDVLTVAVVAVGGSIGVLTGRDGTPIWQGVRVLITVAATAAAICVIRRGADWLCGLIAFLTGVAAAATGAGFGLPHLAKTGWSAVTLAGLAALGAGAVLLVAGAGIVVRRTHRWWRLLVAPALLAVVYVSLWSGVQAVAATNVPATAIGSATPADRGRTYQDVRLQTPDGVRLSGWYLPSTNRAAVLLVHGAGSTRSDVLAHAVVLSGHGYGVLLFDARGHGRSGGRAMDFGWYGDEDLAGAVAFLQSRADVDSDRIAAIGMSMGGEEAIGAAATNTGIRAVIAEGATTRIAADKAFLPDVYGVNGWIQQRVDALTTVCTDQLTDAGPPVTLRAAASAAAPRQFLLITAGDVPDEAHAARHIQRGNANVQLWEVPNTGHTKALSTHPDEWEQRVVAFLTGTLT
ncbi:lysophospholipase [Dactylosporangium sp. NBC_01737]|uniref:alpha/beta hydrolase n=1 Tax=Dactylosporangium sp. NBC_01737 TaxID=2975959 RepID=UPI002E14BEA3|nr:lysophospholipase [Dactylosporangium sp. NBC_01737]